MIAFLQQQSKSVLRCKYGFTNLRRFFLAANSSYRHADCKKQLPDDCYTSNSYYYSANKHITANNIISSTKSINQYCNANNQLRQFSSTIGYHGTPYGGRGRGNDRGRGHPSTNRIPYMKEFNTLDDAIEVYYNNLEILTPRNLSAFWSAVPRLLKYQERGEHLVPQLRAIFHKTADQIHSYGPQDLVTTTLGFAKTIQTLQRSKRGYVSGSYEEYLHGILIGQRDQVFDFIARTVVPILHQFKPRDLKDLAYAYAILDYLPTQLEDGSNLFDHIARTAVPILHHFEPQALANITYAYALLEYVPTLEDDSSLFDHIAEKSIPKLEKFNPQDLSNTVWAFEKVKVSQPDLFKSIGNHIVGLTHLNSFKPQELSNLLVAYAKVNISHPDLFNKVADHIVALEHLNDFAPQALSNIVWAFKKVKVSHPMLYERVGDHIVTLNHLHDFKPQELANIIWSYAKAEVSHPDLFDKVGDHIVSLDNLVGYNEQNISNLAWAYHRAGVIRQDLNDKFIGAAVDRKEEFSRKRLNNLYRWTSEEEGTQIQEDDEQSEEDEDENDSVVAVEGDNNENNIEDDGEIEDYDTTSLVSEDLSLLTVVQLKDRLRNLGLRVSGRKHELISRLNDHLTVQKGDE